MKTFLSVILLLFPFALSAQEESYVRGVVEQVTVERGTVEGQHAQVSIIDGIDEGMQITISTSAVQDQSSEQLASGDTVVLQRLEKVNGEVEYQLREAYRVPALLYLTLFFFLLGILLGGKIGFTSLIGLAVSIGILVFFVVPQILAGHSPVLVCLLGSVLIACTALYVAHGFNRRTSIALVSTIITLLCSVVLAVLFVSVARLFGTGSEESVFLQLGPLAEIDLRGLLLGGIIIGSLGVLDDITTSQTAALDELSKANSSLDRQALYRSGLSIGREHIASLINTLALAYAGAALPMILLLSVDTTAPWWVIINSEFLAEEIVRTLVGSCTLLLAVPISTWLAARSFANGHHTSVEGGHVCRH